MPAKRAIPAAGLIVAMTLVAYVPAIRGGFIWDDDDYVTENDTLRSVDGLRRIWLEPGAVPQYYPLVHTTFWVEYHLWGLNPVGYHLNNVLLHALGAILLWMVLRRLSVPGAWVAAAIFALHPVHVESVAWVTERKNVLSGAFYLGAVLAYLRFCLPAEGDSLEAPQRAGTGRWRDYAVAFGLFVGALLSKTVTATMPAGMLLVIWWQRGRVRRRDVALLAPMLVVGIGSGLATAWIEAHRVGATGADWSLTFVERCLVAGRALWFYAGKLTWPHPLIFTYPRWQIDAAAPWQYLFPLAAAGVAVALWALRHRLGRGPLVAVLFFAGTLGPALGFLNVYPMLFSYVADHFQYLASIGLIALAPAVALRLTARFGAWGTRVRASLAVALLVVLGALTWRQAGVYKDAETLYRDVLIKNPDSFMAHNNLGVLLKERGEFDEAMAHYAEALRAKPDSADLHKSIGVLLYQMGRFDEAISHYRTALRLKPKYPEVHNNLGVALVETGKLSEAVKHYGIALQLQPGHINAHLNLGTTFDRLGEFDKAIDNYAEVLRVDPNHVGALNNMGVALGKKHRMDAAIEQFRHALRIDPGNPETHFNLATVLSGKGQADQAIDHYSEALRIDPDHAKAHNNLGHLLAGRGRIDEAVDRYRKSMALEPNWPEPVNNLAWLLATHPDAKVRKGVEAVRLARRACEMARQEEPGFLDTLAAACAEAGQFEEAVRIARRGAELAAASGRSHLAEEIRARLRCYEAGRPYHESGP